MSDGDTNRHVVVVGGGPGGYAAAFKAADLGLKVTLIDEGENPGGVCLYRGCIPSKALLHVAKLLGEAKEAEAWGVTFGEPTIDLDKLRAFKEKVVSQLTGGLGQLSKGRGITYIRGRGTFVDAHTVTVQKTAGGEESVSFDYAVLATGSRPAIFKAFQVDSDRVMDSTGALELKDIPKRLLVVGGGYIGLEMGSVYAALGSQVDVVEMLPGLLPGADRDLVAVLQKSVTKKFRDIMLETKVAELKATAKQVKVKLEAKDGTVDERTYDRVLIATGRRPNTENLGLETVGVTLTDKGFVQVDAQRRTSVDTIFAIGDVAGEPMLAHKASHEGFVAVETIAGEKVAWEPAAIPGVVFTDPELAWAGLTEQEAKAQGIEVEVAKFPWGASGRATTVDRNDGLTKLIIDPKTQRILGVGIVGVNAGEMIAEGTLAIEMAALASDLKLTIHPHPTLSETIMEAAEVFYGSTTHILRPKKRK